MILNDICEVFSGYALKDFNDAGEGTPVVKIGNIRTDGSLALNECQYTTEEVNEKYYSEKGDIYVALSGATTGKIGIQESEEKYVINQRVGIVRMRDKSIPQVYIKYYLMRHAERILEEAAGCAQPNISPKQIATYEIPDISNKKRWEIANNLDTIVALISCWKRELNLLDDLIKARFVELFGHGNHKSVKASEVCDFITKGTTPPTGEIVEEYEKGMIPFLKVYNLSFTGGLLFDDNPQYIPEGTHNGKLARSKVYPNDVLMNIVGPPLGKFAIVTDEFGEWNINQAIAIFRAKEHILPRFLLHALMQPDVLEPFIGQAVGIRQQNLSLEQCRNLQFPLPSLEEQKAFVEFAEQIDKSRVAVQSVLDKTQLLYESLMQEYFG